MINILTGLPSKKNKDKSVCTNFFNSVGYKIILGSSTMKMYCRELNIIPNIKIIKTNNLPTTKYFINNIDIACEGVITLNEIYKILLNKKSFNDEANEIVKFFKKENEFNFIVGTADNKESDFYKQNNLLPRIEIIKKIIELLKEKKIKISYI